MFIQIFVANPNKPRDVKIILGKNKGKLLELLHNLSPGKGYCAFSWFKTYNYIVFIWIFILWFSIIEIKFIWWAINFISFAVFRFRRWAIWRGKRVYHQGNWKNISLSDLFYNSCVWFYNNSFFCVYSNLIWCKDFMLVSVSK